MVSAVSEAVAAPQHVKGGIHNVQSQQSILDVAKIEEGVQDIDLQTKAPGTLRSATAVSCTPLRSISGRTFRITTWTNRSVS